MQIEEIAGFHKTAGSYGIIYYYNGLLTQTLIVNMGIAIKQILANDKLSNNRRTKIFSSFIEISQNALNYTPKQYLDENEIPCLLSVVKESDNYLLISANLICKQHEQRIRDRLESLQKISNDELLALYYTQLKSAEINDDTVSKGAGLGFLILARNSAKPIEYAFYPSKNHPSELSCFYLKTTL